MAGSGGFKHRKKRLARKRRRSKLLGRENVARAKGIVEAKGQTFDPANHSSQTQLLNHHGRRTAVPPKHSTAASARR